MDEGVELPGLRIQRLEYEKGKLVVVTTDGFTITSEGVEDDVTGEFEITARPSRDGLVAGFERGARITVDISLYPAEVRIKMPEDTTP